MDTVDILRFSTICSAAEAARNGVQEKNLNMFLPSPLSRGCSSQEPTFISHCAAHKYPASLLAEERNEDLQCRSSVDTVIGQERQDDSTGHGLATTQQIKARPKGNCFESIEQTRLPRTEYTFFLHTAGSYDMVPYLSGLSPPLSQAVLEELAPKLNLKQAR